MSRVKTRSGLASIIARRRTTRKALRARRFRLAAIAAALALALGGAGLWSIRALIGNSIIETAVGSAKSLAELLDERSPGQRTQQELTKTNHARALAGERWPKARRVASKPAAGPEVSIDLTELVDPPPVLVTPAELARPLQGLALAPPTSLGTIIAPSVGAAATAGSAATLPTPEAKEIVTPPSAVPEPGTWAMMLLGFVLIGWRTRRRLQATGAAQSVQMP